MIAKTVSVIGTPRIMTGIITDINVASFNPFNEKTEIMKPINNDPVSPR